jgi:hypothetical protein
MSCGCCGKFGKETQIWVFSDQNFPPCLPNPTGKQCLKIVRVENGDLQTIVILLASATHLLREGVAGYIDSYLDTVDRIKIGNRKNILVLPAPFVLMGGCKDPLLLRGIFDFHAWIRISGVDPDGLLNDALGVVEHRIRAEGGEPMQWSPVHYKLPLQLPSKKKMAVYSEGPENLPRGVGPFTMQTEKLIVTSLLSNISEQLRKGGIVVDCDPHTSTSSSSIPERPDILVVGGDHAELTGAALQQRGAAVQLLHIPSYRSSALHAGKIR